MYVLTKFYRNGPDICLNISCRKTVYKTLERKGETGRLAERPRSGCPRLSNVRDDRAIIILSLRDLRETVPFLRASWESYGVSASLTTVRCRLQDAGLHGRKAVRKPLLTPVHCQKRITFAQEHVDWTWVDWSAVLWTDESRFTLFQNDGNVFVRGEVLKGFTMTVLCQQ